MPEYVDLTPTWSEMVPVLVRLAADATTPKARDNAMLELQKLARIGDSAVAKQKAEAAEAADYNRFRVALGLQDGVNLRAIARELVKAADAAGEETQSTRGVYADAAVVLIVNKLDSLVHSHDGFGTAYNECKARSGQ